MGNQPVVPASTVPIQDLLDETNVEAGRTLIGNLKSHGFTVIATDPTSEQTVVDCREAVCTFFDQDDDCKLRYQLPASTDPLIKQRKNRGYIPQNHKEYLKLRYREPSEGFPDTPADLEAKFRPALDLFHSICASALGHIGRGAGAGAGDRLITEKMMDTTRPFIEMGSSVSVVRYHALSREEGDEATSNYAAARADPSQPVERALSNDSDIPEDEHVALRGHFDTGVLTCIMVSEVPGLQVEDRANSEWINIEKIARPHDLVLIMGRKIEMMLSEDARKTSGLLPTWHRVQVKKEIVRHSILYFFDIQTKPEK